MSSTAPSPHTLSYLQLPNRTRIRSRAAESETPVTRTRKRTSSESYVTILDSKRERIDTFKHAPLDNTTGSIRLIEVLPFDTEKDMIQCLIRHATVDADYTCLSYVWGPADSYHTILINDHPFQVRRNLWEFLKIASSTEARTSNVGIVSKLEKHDGSSKDANKSVAFNFESAIQSLWVDAMCIDQNHTFERNHQVQQMGNIYESAQNVIAWVGNEPDLGSLFHQIRTDWYHGRLIQPNKFRKGIPDLGKNEYWTRAWITQEIALARHVFLLAGVQAIGLADLDSAIIHNSTHDAVVASFLRFGQNLPWRAFLDLPSRDARLSLLEYLRISRSKMCSDPRDKIYSLLSIVRDAANIQVDYDITLQQLALNVLERCSNEFCLCQARLVLQALDINKRLYSGHCAHMGDHPFADIYGQTIPVSALKCSRCGDPVHAKIFQRSLSMGRLYMYCFACDHSALSTTQWRNYFGHIVIEVQESGGCRVYHFEKKRSQCYHIVDGIQVVACEDGNDKIGIRISFDVLCQLTYSESPKDESMDDAPSDRTQTFVDSCMRTDANLRWKLISESSRSAQEVRDSSAEGLIRLFELSAEHDSDHKTQSRNDYSYHPKDFLLDYEED